MRRSEDGAIRELRESEQRFDQILRGAEIGTWDWNVETGHVSFNRQWAEMLGYEHHEIASTIRAWRQLTHPDDLPQVLTALNSHFSGQEPTYECEHRLLNRDGEWIWVHSRGRVFEVGNDDGAIRVLGTHLDITERKRLDGELQRAEAANVRFLAKMSHEMRTPLTAVIGFAEALQSGELTNSQQADAVETILSCSGHLLGVINDILDFSNINADESRLQRIPVALGDLLEHIRNIAEPRATKKGLGLTIQLAGDVPEWLLSDSIRIRQILLNLIGNVIKFTEAGTVDLVVTYNTSNGAFVFSVTDSGIGIAPEHIERIFQQFEQADNSATREYGGIGLGLVISARLAELLGGTLSAESAVNRGSTFQLTLPEATVTDAVPSITLGEEPELAIEHTILHGKLLVADDVPTNQKLISYLLQSTALELSFAD